MPNLPPRVVRILGQRIEVKTVANVNKAIGHEGHDDPSQAGNANMAFGLVHVSKHQSPDQLADTYLHELLHIMLMFVLHDDEQLVMRLAPVLLDFMRSNPRAVEYLLGGKKRVITGW